MVWKETFPPASELALDAEVERERRLAAQARAGADWALTALIARYQPTVTRYLTRLCGDQGRARALAEDVFQRMERRLHGPHGGDSLRLWLLRASTEAGLEALRRPQRPNAPRLGASLIAGLLPSETESGSQNALRGGIKRLRGVVGAVSRQVRPLVWQGTDITQRAAPESEDERMRKALELGPVDDSLDALDPREALRHRLVRLTLADLPYGDAQCLALHLVAGLNQAEVARALGITSSAARKRIVNGLTQFSARYKAAVVSLGLPEELGYGDAAPQPAVYPATPIAAPEPAPVIVPQTPEEIDSPAVQSAPTTIPLAVNSFDEDGETLSGVMYYEASSPGESPAYHVPAAPSHLSSEDGSPYAGFAGAGDAPETFAAPYAAPPAMAVMGEGQEALGAVEAPGDEDADKPGASSTGHSGVMRIAPDAIVGPVVDALPIHSEPLSLEPLVVEPGPRSTPLVYELASGDMEQGSITMNWLDSTGMLAPLSFEAIAMPAPADGKPVEDDDLWARSTILELETPAESPSSSASLANAEESSPAPDIAGEALEASTPPLDMSIALDEGNYGWERSHQDATVTELDDVSLAYELFPLDDQAHAVSPDGPSRDQATDQPDAARPAPPVARTLEEIWDETPDAFGR